MGAKLTSTNPNCQTTSLLAQNFVKNFQNVEVLLHGAVPTRGPTYAIHNMNRTSTKSTWIYMQIQLMCIYWVSHQYFEVL